MSTEAEKSRRVISELRAAIVLRRMRRVESVTRRKCVAAFLFAYRHRHFSFSLLPLFSASFIVAAGEGARNFIAAENRNDYATPLFLSLFRRPPSALIDTGNTGKIRAPSRLEFLNIQRCTAACREKNMKRTNRTAPVF